MKRRIEITAFEHERILSHGILTHCPVCCRPTELLTMSQAVAMVQVEPHSIDLWLVEGKTHGAKTPGGDQRICRNSLLTFNEP